MKISVRVWSNGDSVQALLGLGSRRRSHEPRGGGATEVLDGEANRDRHGGKRKTKFGHDSRESTRGNKRAALE